MDNLPSDVLLTNCRTEAIQHAKVVTLTRDLASERITARWWADLNVSGNSRRSQLDHPWNWTKLVGNLKNDKFARCVAVQTPDGEIQAALIYRINGRSFREPNRVAIYGDRIAAAPRNRAGLTVSPLYRGAGTALILYAVCHSYQIGLGGGMTLFSLPTPDTRIFYEKQGFEETGSEHEGMIPYELLPDWAKKLLRKRGML